MVGYMFNDKKQFDELEDMRKDLNWKEEDLREEKEFLDKLRDSQLMIINELRDAIQVKEQSYLKDKETIAAFDAEHKTSNNAQRLSKIKKLLAKEHNALKKFREESSRAIEYYEKIIKDLEQELKDFKRAYSNLRDYYKSEKQPVVIIDSNLIKSLEE